MTYKLPLSKEQKLTVTFRVEPGCLGPEGDKLVVDFCVNAQKEIESVESDCINWSIIPRTSKEDSEIQLEINRKIITQAMAKKYLSFFDVSFENLEHQLLENITFLIEQYMER